MTASVYFANMGRVRIKIDATHYDYVGIIKKIEIKVTWEFAPLRGMNSILRQGLVKYNQEVEVSISYGLFDADPANDLFARALCPCLDGTTTPTRVSQLSTTGVCDTNKVFMFEIEAFITDEASASCAGTPTPQYIKYTVDGCYFESIPFVTSNENEWIVRDLTCKGRDVKVEKLAAKPAVANDPSYFQYWYPAALVG